MRRPLLLVLSLLTATAACTTLLGDFTVTTTGSDAGTDSGKSDGGGEETATAIVSAAAEPVSVYIGQTAKLDGSKSTTSEGNLSYSWTFEKGVGVPAGSAVTSAGILGAASATPSFVPDVLGVYTLLFTASAFGVNSTIPVTVTAVLPSVFYAQGTVKGTGGTAVYTVADFDGGFEAGSAHTVVCPTVVTTSIPHEIATFGAFAGRAYDFWEAPAGEPSRFAGFLMDYNGSYTAHLYTGTSASRCGADGGPLDFGTTDFGTRPYGSNPHFRPDGKRFVVYSSSSNNWDIVTYSFDGTPPTNHIAQYPVAYSSAPGGSGLDPTGALSLGGGDYTQEPPRVEWTANGLAWAVPQASGWAIMTAPDEGSATPSTFMTCTGVVPREIAMLADNSVVASYRQAATSGENLVRLQPDPNTGKCVTVVTYTTVGNVSGAIATDFSVSPDGTQIAFLQVDPTSGTDVSPWLVATDASTPTQLPQLPGGYVYTVPVKGGTPSQVSTTPAIYGPRWIGGGASLVFTGLLGTTDAGAGTFGLATTVVVVQPDGSGETVVAQGDGVTTFVSTSGNAACSTAPGERGAPAAGALLSLAAIAEIVRRRSRRR